MSLKIYQSNIVSVVPYLQFFFENRETIKIYCPDEITYETDPASYFRCVLSAFSPHQFKKTSNIDDLLHFFKENSVSPFFFKLPYRFFVSGSLEDQKQFMTRVTDIRFEHGVFFWLNDISTTEPNKAWFCVKKNSSTYTFYCFSGSDNEEKFIKLYNLYNTDPNTLEIKTEKGNFFDKIVTLAFNFYSDADADGAEGDIDTSKMKDLTFFIDKHSFDGDPKLFENVFGLAYKNLFHRDREEDDVDVISKISTAKLKWTDLLDDDNKLCVLYSALEEFSEGETSATMHLQSHKVFDTFFRLVVKCFLEEKRKFFIAVDVFFANFFSKGKMENKKFNRTFFKLDLISKRVIADPDLLQIFEIIKVAYFTKDLKKKYYEQVPESSIKQVTKLIFYQCFEQSQLIFKIFEICALQF